MGRELPPSLAGGAPVSVAGFRPDAVTCEWQRLDPQLGIVQPWFTHPALDVVQSWNLADKTVLEWGGGCSTVWWARRCKRVYTIEAHREWADAIAQWLSSRGIGNAEVHCRWPDPEEEYLRVPDDLQPDIVVVDGSSRSACIRKALSLPRPLMLIVDNWQQDGVYIDEEMEREMSVYRGRSYRQPGHVDHQGRPWKTAIWRLS